jgi:hypothetical protein
MIVDKTQAWELLHDPEYCGKLNMEGMRRLMIRAGYSVDVAQKAATQRGWERLSEGVEM